MTRQPICGSWVRIVVVVGGTNTPENRRDIALGKYTHIFFSSFSRPAYIFKFLNLRSSLTKNLKTLKTVLAEKGA
jgi:hypothetical protein